MSDSKPCTTAADPLAPEVSGEVSRKVAPNKTAIRKSTKSRWRALALVSIHVLFVIHLSTWFIYGATLSPVEPSESMFTLEEGQLNCGFVFFGVSILSVFIFGRFFCGWGCHIVALQDLCSWILAKLHIRPRTFRTRFMVYVPYAVAFYMFFWPTLKRWGRGAEAPKLENHFVTTDFWGTFAPWPVAIPFLFICGFAVVYFLGSKGFCKYGCPYGAFFAVADRFAFGQIRANLDKCEQCGHCTATCSSNVRVHEEIQVSERVTSDGCFKCLDCVSVCPTGALSYGYTMPKVFSPAAHPQKRKSKRYDVTLAEELCLIVVALALFFGIRGYCDVVPMLMAIGVSGCFTFLAWKSYRLLRDREVRLNGVVLKRQGKIRIAGWIWSLVTIVGIATCIHGGVINLSIWRAERITEQLAISDVFLMQNAQPQLPAATVELAEKALALFTLSRSFDEGGISWRSQQSFYGISLVHRLAFLELALGRHSEALSHLQTIFQQLYEQEREDQELTPDALSSMSATEIQRYQHQELSEAQTLDKFTWLYARSLSIVAGTDAAEGVVRNALAVEGDLRMSRVLLAQGLIGERLQNARGAGNLAQALELAREAVQIAPGSPVMVQIYVELLQANGDTEEANRWQQHLRKLLPPPPPTQNP